MFKDKRWVKPSLFQLYANYVQLRYNVADKIKTSIRFYDDKPVRSLYDEKTNRWFYVAKDLMI